MGYYVQTAQPKNKAADIIRDLDAIEVTVDEAEFFIKEQMGAVICVVDNGPFEAAAYCFNLNEFRAFNDPNDDRVKTWLYVENEAKVKQAVNFTKPSGR